MLLRLLRQLGTLLPYNGFRKNLKRNAAISITAIDEQQFTGFSLKGKARIVESKEIEDHIIKAWEDRVIRRVSKRVIGDIKREKEQVHHPEALFPRPEYLIEMEVEDVVDLTPGHLKPKT